MRTHNGSASGHLRFPCWCEDEHLSDGEVNLIALLASGLTTEEVASTMFVSPHTVAHRLSRVLEKCVARNRTELVAKAYAAGVLRAGDWPPRWSGQSCLSGTANGARRDDPDRGDRAARYRPSAIAAESS